MQKKEKDMLCNFETKSIIWELLIFNEKQDYLCVYLIIYI